ncbi:HMG-Y-related protein A-like [Senna tora]|uniref:HMG-Y-related protein A n=1 Tax=Senna tora TaxID=362788 RepID=A0A834TYI2_9FABA|nr:HMG-Y-related protein A-like [Senna tora]
MATEEVNKPPSLPPYPEMIMKALEALNEESGSNKSAIAKYIESTFGEMPAGHTTLLSHHLNKMKENGDLVFMKNNYMKPDPNAPPKRGRGRPPKPKDPLAPGTVLSPPRPRGRPPKDPNAPPKPKTTAASGRPRGRPKKIARSVPTTTSMPAVNVTAGSGRPRGRPPKEKPAFQEVSVEQ